jgi:hypothetical protein
MAGTLTVQNLQGPSSGANANKIIIPSGQTLYAPGHVVQVVSANKNLSSDSTTGSGSYIDAGLSASITPTSANSKIYVVAHFNGLSGSGNWLISTLARDGTSLAGSDGLGITQAGNWVTTALTVVDSPATTSSVTYSLQVKRGGTGTAYYHWNGSIDTITLMEIAQ